MHVTTATSSLQGDLTHYLLRYMFALSTDTNGRAAAVRTASELKHLLVGGSGVGAASTEPPTMHQKLCILSLSVVVICNTVLRSYTNLRRSNACIY